MSRDVPSVSVVIPAYNRAQWLPVSIGSVLRQGFGDWEAIVVDDRSTDETRETVERFASEDSRIRCVRNERAQGPSGARNHGVSLARGKYIAFLDSDDEWEPFHLERMVHLLEAYPDRIDVATANPLRKKQATGEVFNYDELDLDRFRYERIEDAYLLDSDGLFALALDGVRLTTTQTIVARRQVCEQIPWDEEVGAGEDCLFPMEVALKGFRIAHIQDYHVTYWAHDDNLTNCNGGHDPQRMIPVYEAFTKYFQALLRKFDLTPAQRRDVEKKMADHFVWKLGYHGYLQTRDFASARRSFRAGIRLNPWRPLYWKSYIMTYVKQLFSGTEIKNE